MRADLFVKTIDFDEIRTYWIAKNHFQDKNKKIIENVRYLGPYTNTEDSPRYCCYGLFLKEELVGVTMLRAWNNEWVRYRTLNIDAKLRGQNIGWDFLMTAYQDGWQGRDIFGWVRRTHLAWTENHHFKPINGVWQGEHIAMVLGQDKIKELEKRNGFSILAAGFNDQNVGSQGRG